MIVIEPNKKMAWIFLLVEALIFALGYYEFNFRPYDSWIVFSLIPMSGKGLGILLMSLLIFPLYCLIFVYRTKKRIYLNPDSITLFDGRIIDFMQIDKVVISSVYMVKTGVDVHLKDGSKVSVPSLFLHCGITKFANILCEKVNEKRQPAET